MASDDLWVQIEVLDEANAVVEWYRLYIESISNPIMRTPVVVSLPSINRGGEGGDPSAYAIDFGLMTEHVTVKGVVNDNEVRPYVPSFEQLMNIARNGWRYTKVTTAGGQIAISGGIRFIFNAGAGQGTHGYQGVVQSLTPTREGGQLRWEYTLTIQRVVWPDILYPLAALE